MMPRTPPFIQECLACPGAPLLQLLPLIPGTVVLIAAYRRRSPLLPLILTALRYHEKLVATAMAMIIWTAILKPDHDEGNHSIVNARVAAALISNNAA